MIRVRHRKAHHLPHDCRSESGQAQAEYVIAVALVLVITLALVGLIVHFNGSDKKGSKHSEKTFKHAPYTIPNSNGLSGQWLKDILIH